MASEEDESIPADAFYRAPAPFEWPPRHHDLGSLPASAFFVEPPAPEEPSFMERYPARPLVFGSVLLLLGVLGILLQRGFLRQIVIGAPVFEEFAKFGLALTVVALLRLRPIVLRLPVAWASGAAFGVFEHAMDYADEGTVSFAARVAFHAGSAGLSMAAFTLLEGLPDVRVRWASTLASSLCHWANNFGAIALAVVGILLHDADVVDLAWSLVVTAAVYALTLVVALGGARLRPLVARELQRVFPPPPSPSPAAEAPTAPSPGPPSWP
jgi:hypothetical protein